MKQAKRAGLLDTIANEGCSVHLGGEVQLRSRNGASRVAQRAVGRLADPLIVAFSALIAGCATRAITPSPPGAVPPELWKSSTASDRIREHDGC